MNIEPKTKPKLSKAILQIYQMNKAINPKLSKLINQLINQKYV